jgi:transcriptional regulator GlxA family with amidase domain
MSNRRTFLKSAALGAPAMLLGSTGLLAQAGAPQNATLSINPAKALTPPANGQINVAFVISEDANVMDIAGAWEVFSETMLTAKGKLWHETDGMKMDDMLMPFNTYTVSDSLKPLRAGNGLMIVPNYSFETVPKPQIIVIPAQKGRTEAQKAWLLTNSAISDITMSVCTGAEVLAQYGLLDGLTATTHHLFAADMQQQYPAVHFVSGTRFVDHGKIATAGGLTSGIDLALHVVARYYGQDVAQVTAKTLEYRGDLWKNPQFGEIKPVVAIK